MSLATAANRRAAASVALPFMLAGVMPDGSNVDSYVQRTHAGWAYGQPFVVPIAFDADTDSIRWVCRVSAEESVVCEVATDSSFTSPIASDAVTADPDMGYVAKGEVTGLAADTVYYHRFKVDGTVRTYVTAPTGGGTTAGYLRTAPEVPDPGDTYTIRIAIGGDTLDGNGTAWQGIDSKDPHLFIHLGDRSYVDTQIESPPTSINAYISGMALLHRNYSDAEGRFTRYIALRRACKFIPDDHDFGVGDIDLATTDFQTYRDWGFDTYTAFTPHGTLVNAAAIYRKESWGPVDLFFIDGRYQKQDTGDYDRFPDGGSDTHEISSSSTASSIIIVDSGAGHTTDKTADAYKGWYVRLSQAHYARTVVRPAHSDLWRRVLSSAQSAADAVTLTLESALPSTFDATVDKYLFMEKASILDGSDTPFATGNQWEWLVDALNASTARYRIIVCPMPMEETQTADDNWRKYSALCGEVRTLYQMLDDPCECMVVSADFHRHCLDNGTNGEFPEACSAPLDAAGTDGAVSTWSHGQATRPTDNPDGTQNGFLLLTITQDGVKVEFFWTNSGTPTAMGGISSLSLFPSDGDCDADVTARTDVDAATIRPVRAVFAHIADGVRNAEWTGFDRLLPDRYRARSSREGRNPRLGHRFKVKFEGNRAGEAWALDSFHVELSPEGRRPTAADTTARTDVDAATARVPSFILKVAADDLRNASLSTIGAAVQKRFVSLPDGFAIPTAEGRAKRFRVVMETDGRAGDAWALDRILLELSPDGEAHPALET